MPATTALATAPPVDALPEPELYRIWRECAGRDWEPVAPYDYVQKSNVREQARRRFAYAIPTNAVLAALVPYGPFVEIGAGTGYWASLLLARGVEVLAYDHAIKGDHSEHTYCDVDNPFVLVQKGTSANAADHPDHTLLLVWPPYADPMATEALAHYTGSTLVYAGEGSGGCTGDDTFHDALAADWEQIEEHAIPQWWGLHDWLWVYRRKGQP